MASLPGTAPALKGRFSVRLKKMQGIWSFSADVPSSAIASGSPTTRAFAARSTSTLDLYEAVTLAARSFREHDCNPGAPRDALFIGESSSGLTVYFRDITPRAAAVMIPTAPAFVSFPARDLESPCDLAVSLT